MTLIWLLIWFIADLIGDDEPLLLDPVNIWTGTLILAIDFLISFSYTLWPRQPSQT